MTLRRTEPGQERLRDLLALLMVLAVASVVWLTLPLHADSPQPEAPPAAQTPTAQAPITTAQAASPGR